MQVTGFQGILYSVFFSFLLLFFKVRSLHYSDRKEGEQVCIVSATFSLPACILGLGIPARFLPYNCAKQGKAVPAAPQLEVTLLEVTGKQPREKFSNFLFNVTKPVLCNPEHFSIFSPKVQRDILQVLAV